MSDFDKQVKDFTKLYRKRMKRVFRQSFQDTVNEANLSNQKGGRMPIDTGFLRASGGAALNKLPSGPTTPKDAIPGEGPITIGRIREQLSAKVAADQSVTQVLGKWQPGDTAFYGWTANYARFRESIDGFMRGATEKWDATVARNAKKARARER